MDPSASTPPPATSPPLPVLSTEEEIPHLVTCQVSSRSDNVTPPARPPPFPSSSSSTALATEKSSCGSASRSAHATEKGHRQDSVAHVSTASSVASAVHAAPQVSVFDNTKAGLQSVNKEKTEALIKELSKNSSFYTNEERKAQKRQQHIDALLVKSRQYEATVKSRPEVLRQVQRDVAALEANVEAHREFEHVYVHMDMDMFYAAVEMKKNPQYASVPLGIGSIGMLSTTNYVARQFGVRSGMPGFIGLHLCPQLVIVGTDFPACKVESDKFKAVVRQYDPTAHGHGWDEILICLNDYLDVHFMNAATHDERFDAAEKVIAECRQRVTEATQLTASAGIAPTPTLAKMASNYKKPNGQSTLRLFSRDAVMNFLAPIPVRQVPGIGKSQESILAGLGIHTLGEIYVQRHRLYYILTRKTYGFLLCSAMGMGGMYDAQLPTASAEDGTLVENDDDGGRKSVGQERTFPQLTNKEALQGIAYRNLREAQSTIVEEQLLSSLVVLKLKYRTFQVKQYSKSLHVYTDNYDVLQRALDELLIPVLDSYAEFRLLGVRLERLKVRADTDGAGGSVSVPKVAAEDETGQRTLSDFFTQMRQQTSRVPRRTTASSNVTKRPRMQDIEISEDDDGDSDVSDAEVQVVTSLSQKEDSEEVVPLAESVATEKAPPLKKVAQQPLVFPRRKVVVNARKTAAPSNVDVSDVEENDDDDVIFVE